MTAPTPAPRRAATVAWCLYDWANSAYPTVIATFVFAAYFTRGVAPDEIAGTTAWGNAMGISGPADRRSRPRPRRDCRPDRPAEAVAWGTHCPMRHWRRAVVVRRA